VQLGGAAGAHVTATVRNPAARDAVAELGAHEVLAPADFAGHGPYDVILELVGAPNMTANVESLEIGGRIVVIGVAAGQSAEVNLRMLMDKRAAIRASSLRTRCPEEKATIARGMERHVISLFDRGHLSVPVARTFPLHAVRDAYDHFAAGGKVGKIVLVMGD
jgi:NADPH:quinone reductase-like Zn-dependent oxidoreductase